MILTALGFGAAAGQLYPDFVGKRAIFVGTGLGPVAPTNAAATADPISLALSNYYIDAVMSGASTDGTTFMIAFPYQSAGPRASWKAFYFTVGTAAPINGVDLSGKTFVVSAFVGQF
jgi:hypothetical protein